MLKASLEKAFSRALDRAREGDARRLSRIFSRLIPFNRPHGFRIEKMGPEGVAISLPHRRRNLNHLGTLHACALATCGEFAAGLCLLDAFDLGTHRLIMSKLECTYHKRPSGPALATASLAPSVLADLGAKLADSGKATCTMQTELHDAEGTHCVTVRTDWQIKRWSQVKNR